MSLRALMVQVSFVAAMGVAGTSSAHAQPEEDPEYRSLIAEAVSEFDAQRFAEARALFLRAHARSPNARTLRGIGMASYELGDYVDALRALSGALDETRRALTDAQRTEVATLRDRAARFVGRYRVVVTPATAIWTLDGAAVEVGADGRIAIAIGRHEIVARAPGHREARATVQVRGGEDEQVPLTLEPIAAEGGDPVEDPDPREVSPGPDDLATPAAPPQPSRTTPLVLLVGGGALVVASVIIGIAGWMSRNDAIDECLEALDRGDVCTNLDTLELERGVSAALTIGLGVAGAAGIAIGGIWLGSF